MTRRVWRGLRVAVPRREAGGEGGGGWGGALFRGVCEGVS